MAVTDLPLWLVRELIAQRGTSIGMPRRDGVSEEAMEDAIAGLHRRACLTVVGPGNQNRSMGQDIDKLALLPHDAALMRAIRR